MNFMARGKTEEIDWDAAADIPADFGEGLDDLAGTDLGGTEEPDGDLGGLTDGHWDQLMEQAGRLKEALAGLPVFQAPSPAAASTPAPAAKPVVKTVKKYDFNLDVVFQTMYELCTNETVKDHIKAMRADQNKAFDTQMILKSLSDTAPTTPVEDTFYNFSIAAILKTLFQATNNEKFKAVLKKMNQTTGTIFLDAILPIEGSVTEERITETPAAAPTVPAALAPAARPGLTADTIGQLNQLAEELLTALEEHRRLQEEEPQLPDLPDEAMLPDSSQVSSEDRDRIVYSVARANDTVRRIMGSVTRILEALSFQDLSGQRIFKIVKLISDVQVQLLTLLVSYGAKIKQKKEDQVTSRQDQEKLAQNEVDRMLERVALGPSELVGPGADGRLNQDAVDSLLGDLGF
jgi:hypothetical protein